MAIHNNYFLEFSNIISPYGDEFLKIVYAHINEFKFMARLFSRVIATGQQGLISKELIPELNLCLTDSNHQFEYGIDELEVKRENYEIKIFEDINEAVFELVPIRDFIQLLSELDIFIQTPPLNGTAIVDGNANPPA